MTSVVTEKWSIRTKWKEKEMGKRWGAEVKGKLRLSAASGYA
jgi:hypothetical protein